MAKDNFIYITDKYSSNCLIEAIKAKLRNPSGVKIYFCKPRITENGNFQWLHFMWSDKNYSYDFSDDEETEIPWYRTFWYKGRIRQFKKDFAKRYTTYRNSVRGRKPYETYFR